jgi:hypothetical protein
MKNVFPVPLVRANETVLSHSRGVDYPPKTAIAIEECGLNPSHKDEVPTLQPQMLEPDM